MLIRYFSRHLMSCLRFVIEKAYLDLMLILYLSYAGYPGYQRFFSRAAVQLFNSDSSYDISKTSETFFFVQCVIKSQFFQ